MKIEINVDRAILYMVRHFYIYGEPAQIAAAVFRYWNDYACNHGESIETYLTAMFSHMGFSTYHVNEMMADNAIEVTD